MVSHARERHFSPKYSSGSSVSGGRKIDMHAPKKVTKMGTNVYQFVFLVHHTWGINSIGKREGLCEFSKILITDLDLSISTKTYKLLNFKASYRSKVLPTSLTRRLWRSGHFGSTREGNYSSQFLICTSLNSGAGEKLRSKRIHLQTGGLQAESVLFSLAHPSLPNSVWVGFRVRVSVKCQKV